jgi:PAS domain S-box-containing protein
MSRMLPQSPEREPVCAGSHDLALARLREAEIRYRAIAEGTRDVLIELDDDDVMRFVSPAVEGLLGWKPEELVGRPAYAILLAEEHELYRKALVDVRDSRWQERPGPALHAMRLVARDASTRWVEASARAFATGDGERRVLGIVRDASAHRELEQALRRQVDFERGLAELSRRLLTLSGDEVDAGVRDVLDLAARLAGADRAYLYVFPHGLDGVAEFHGLPRSFGDLRARRTLSADEGYRIARRRYAWLSSQVASGTISHVPDVSRLPDEACAERGSFLRRGVRSFLNIPLRNREVVLTTLNFERMREMRSWSETEIRQLVLVAEIFGNALRRKHSEEALRHSQSQLLQSQKMEAVGRLAGGIAHDFNNLLMVIGGYSDSLLTRLAVSDPSRADVEEIGHAVERATALTRQLLAFSRPHGAGARTVAANDAVKDLEAMLGRLLAAHIELGIELDPRAGFVRADPAQLQQVVMNLAVNASDAMPSGGKLTLRTEHRTLRAEEAAELGLASAGEHVRLVVTDTGCGMDEETLSHAFDPFFTTKRSDRGTGLGLSIVYGIVRQLGGAIRVESKLDVGTTFHLYLPTAETGRTGAAGDRGTATAASETVLVAEDDDSVRKLVRQILEQRGYRVIEARSGREALLATAREPGPIHLLLSDVVMPGTGGGELAARLKKLRPDVRVLLVSGYPPPADRGEDVPPVDGFLRKPFQAEQLLDEVRRVLSADPSESADVRAPQVRAETNPR